MSLRRLLLCLLGFIGSALASPAASPYRQPTSFTFTGDVGFGNSVFVVGNHPDVGSWDYTRAVKLRFTPGNVWTGQIAIQAGTALEYRFLSRATATNRWTDPANGVLLGSGNLSRSILPAQPEAPYRGKTVYYLSSWPRVDLLYRDAAGGWSQAVMANAGSGRVAGETLWKASGIGEAGEALEFVFSNGQGAFDNPPGGGNYLTPVDVLHVQDGNVWSYRPAATPSAARIEPAHFVNSTAPNIAGRNVRVLLPRGYAENTWKRYPVLYLHDGQNVFDPGGPFGSWSADATAARETGQGRMREAILVAVDNGGDARIPEYLPPTDAYQGQTGRVDAYAAFLIHNVRPYVDATYRTLSDPANTLTLGSSLGGLVSLYLGREFPGVFGKVGVLSPAFWIAPNYRAQAAGQPRRALRVYLDMGTEEGASHWDNCQSVFDLHLAQGHAANGDLLFVAGAGQPHNESAWAARLPGVLRFLLPAGEEPAQLAQRDFPPRLTVTELMTGAPGRAAFSVPSLFGFAYALERSNDLQGGWVGVVTVPPEEFPWGRRTLEDLAVPAGNGGHTFWRLRYPAQP